MKRLWQLLGTAVVGLVLAAPAHATDYYFDNNGSTALFGYPWSSAPWDSTTANWTTDPTGSSSTVVWPGGSDVVAWFFGNSTTAAGMTLYTNVTVAGIVCTNTASSGSLNLNASGGAWTVTVHNATIKCHNLTLAPQTSVVFAGDFQKIGPGTLQFAGSSGQIAAGSTVTLTAGNIALQNTVTTANNNFVINGGQLQLNYGTLPNVTTNTIGNLSGAGGVIRERSPTVNGARAAVLRVTQTSDLTYSGQITDNVSGANTNKIGLVKAGAANLTLAGSALQLIGRGIAVNEGTLTFNSTNSAIGGVIVKNGGTLAGNGHIITLADASVIVESGGKLSPGTSPGTLQLTLGTGKLDLSAIASSGLIFELGGTSDSDKVLLNSGVLKISELDLTHFAFSTVTGFGPGTYTLFDTGSTIDGSLGATLTGTLGGYNIELKKSLDSQDILLEVIPEPSTMALLFAGLGWFALARIKRRQG
jgi:hypothetical protein